MTEQEAFDYNKNIALKHNLFAGEILFGQDDDWLGMVYFRDTSMESLQDQKHFAYVLDFINEKEHSEILLERLLDGVYL